MTQLFSHPISRSFGNPNPTAPRLLIKLLGVTPPWNPPKPFGWPRKYMNISFRQKTSWQEYTRPVCFKHHPAGNWNTSFNRGVKTRICRKTSKPSIVAPRFKVNFATCGDRPFFSCYPLDPPNWNGSTQTWKNPLLKGWTLQTTSGIVVAIWEVAGSFIPHLSGCHMSYHLVMTWKITIFYS